MKHSRDEEVTPMEHSRDAEIVCRELLERKHKRHKQSNRVDIYAYLRSKEIEDKRRPKPDYIKTVQRSVTASMRGNLVDWLVEVAEAYDFLSDTIFLAVSYIDRYLSSNTISRGRLQLLGVSCMLIASKYEETQPLRVDVEHFFYITDDTYTKQEVLDMEVDILETLNFEVGNPTIKTFLWMFTTLQSDLQLDFLACYLAELSLLNYDCIRFLPSLVAASVIFLANFTCHPETQPWSLSLEKLTGYKPCDLKDCVLNIHDLQLSRGGSVAAVRDRYKLKKFKSLALLSSLPDIPLEYFDEIQR